MAAVKSNAADAPDLTELLSLFARLRPGAPANWSTRYRIGVILSKHLDAHCTLAELGRALGVTPQNAYTESVLALGTLVCALYVRMHFGRYPLPAGKQ
ncbi:hypothetical protein C667_02853 [Thauera phenylacetica B4P]|uniref:Uncharacterized protein n=1 Tax=Thauera phenylacetica B4P TaxID=1234382 RepID=N7A2T4_9RHOO|nr:hypothetical protein C667_02853 [Thauera phenylacetica B4P]